MTNKKLKILTIVAFWVGLVFGLFTITWFIVGVSLNWISSPNGKDILSPTFEAIGANFAYFYSESEAYASLVCHAAGFYFALVFEILYVISFIFFLVSGIRHKDWKMLVTDVISFLAGSAFCIVSCCIGYSNQHGGGSDNFYLIVVLVLVLGLLTSIALIFYDVMRLLKDRAEDLMEFSKSHDEDDDEDDDDDEDYVAKKSKVHKEKPAKHKRVVQEKVAATEKEVSDVEAAVVENSVEEVSVAKEEVVEETVVEEKPAVEDSAVKEESQIEVKDETVEKVTKVVDPKTAALFTGKRKHISFEQKLKDSSDELRSQYKEISEYITSYGIKSRISTPGDTYSAHRVRYAYITITGRHMKIYFPLDPKDYKDTTIPFEVSDAKKFEDLPMMLRIRSGLSLRRAEELVDEVMKKKGVKKPSSKK